MSKISNYLLPLNSTIIEAANIINSSKNRACVVVEDDNHVIGILSEISQYYLLIPGTFDIIDLIMYFIFPIFVIKLVLWKTLNRCYQYFYL